RALVVYGLTGVGTLVLNLRWRRAEATYTGLALLAATTLWGLWWLQGRITPPWSAVLAAEALGLGIFAAWLRGQRVGAAEGAAHPPSAGILTRFSSALALGA